MRSRQLVLRNPLLASAKSSVFASLKQLGKCFILSEVLFLWWSVGTPGSWVFPQSRFQSVSTNPRPAAFGGSRIFIENHNDDVVVILITIITTVKKIDMPVCDQEPEGWVVLRCPKPQPPLLLPALCLTSPRCTWWSSSSWSGWGCGCGWRGWGGGQVKLC